MPNDFTFHKVSDKEKEEIKTRVQGILKVFSDKLSEFDEKIPEPFIERKKSEREELPEGKEKINENFRKRMLKNAPNKNEDFIIAEKKGW